MCAIITFGHSLSARYGLELSGKAYHMVPMKIGKRETQRLAKRAEIIGVARQHFFENG